MPPNIRLSIETIIVEGMDAREAGRFREALLPELTRQAELVEDWSLVGNADALSVVYDGRPEKAARDVSAALLGVSKP